jgi:SEL1 protein
LPEDNKNTVSLFDHISNQKPLTTIPLLQITSPPMSDLDQAAEASRAYKHALATLAALTAPPPSYTHDPSTGSSSTASNSLLSSILPNFQGQGPFGSALRIAVKLQQRLFAKTTFSRLGYKKKRDDENRGKAIKVKDLLQHSAELGNEEALYKLAHISLVCYV